MRAVVVTNLIYAVDPAHQLRCLHAWEDLGCTVRVAAPAQDRDMVARSGWPRQATLDVPGAIIAPTGQAAPRLIDLLEAVLRQAPGQALILTSPGVYPAVRSFAGLAAWMQISAALGLGSEAVGLFEAAQYSRPSPCRRQIDTFVIAASHIPKVIQALTAMPAGGDLCLGCDTWDLVLGDVICSPAVGGRIADSAVLLREAAGIPLPRQVSAGLGAACAANAALSGRIRTLHFAAPALMTDLPQVAHDHAARVQYLVPWVRWNYDLNLLTALIARMLRPMPLPAAQILSALEAGPNATQQTSEAMLAMVIWALCHPDAARALRSSFATTPALAQANQAQLLHIQTLFRDDLVGLRHALTRKAACDMIDHGVWTPAQQDAVARACHNDADRMLFDTLTHHTREAAHAA